MIVKLTCPVCDRRNIENNICPNCETDLSLIRMLEELPQRQSTPIWFLITVAISSLILGFTVGALT